MAGTSLAMAIQTHCRFAFVPTKLQRSLRSYLVLIQNDAFTRCEDALESPCPRRPSATGRLTRSLPLSQPGWSHVPMPSLHDIWEQALATSRRHVARRGVLRNSPKTAAR